MRMTVCSISFNTDFVMEQTNREWTLHEVRDLFVRDCPQVTAWASECGSGEAFRQRLKEELQHRENLSAKAARTLRIMADYDGRTVHELSTGEDVRLETMTLLWRFLTQQMVDDAVSIDFALDLYHLFSQLFRPVSTLPGAAQVRQWMDRWPDGMDETVQAVRRANKERMVPLLVRRIEQRPASLRHYVFASGMTAEEKRRQVRAFTSYHPLREVSVIYSRHYTKQKLIELLCAEIRQVVPPEMLNKERGRIVEWRK